MLTRAQLGFLVAGTAVVALAVVVVTRPREPRPTPAASFDSSNVDVVPLEDLRAYLARLDFDAVPGAADERPVDFERGLIGVGKTARIEPEVGSYRVTYEDLARGRIIARIKSEAVYDRWGLGPWWTYWWVDKKGGRWHWVFIPDTSSRTSRPRVPTEPPKDHPGHHWRQAIARWVIGSGVRPWGTCGDWCCN